MGSEGVTYISSHGVDYGCRLSDVEGDEKLWCAEKRQR
jgi:hypothetical protein